ncbi:hypothetical protein AWP45_18460, partial [Escherichia coli]
RPDTACGLQAEKTGRFSLHWRDNTRQRKLADFLCTGGIIQGLISVAHQAVWRLSSEPTTS